MFETVSMNVSMNVSNIPCMKKKLRPCLSKYWNGKIYFPNREISLALILFVLQFTTDWLLYYRIRYFYFVAVVLASTITGLPLKTIPDLRPQWSKSIMSNVILRCIGLCFNYQNLHPFSDQTGSKTIPFGAAHTYIAYIGEYPPPRAEMPRDSARDILRLSRDNSAHARVMPRNGG